MRDTPVIVFINKMDRDGKNRFDLLEEIEKELNIQLHPMTWPINSGKDFKGVYNLYDKNLVLFMANTKATDEDMIKIDRLDSAFAQARPQFFDRQVDVDHFVGASMATGPRWSTPCGETVSCVLPLIPLPFHLPNPKERTRLCPCGEPKYKSEKQTSEIPCFT